MASVCLVLLLFLLLIIYFELRDVRNMAKVISLGAQHGRIPNAISISTSPSLRMLMKIYWQTLWLMMGYCHWIFHLTQMRPVSWLFIQGLHWSRVVSKLLESWSSTYISHIKFPSILAHYRRQNLTCNDYWTKMSNSYGHLYPCWYLHSQGNRLPTKPA